MMGGDDDYGERKKVRVIIMASSSSSSSSSLLHRPKRIVTTTNMWKACLADFPAIAVKDNDDEDDHHHHHPHTAEKMRQVLESIGQGETREIAKKLRGYSSQDKLKGIFDADRLITFAETIELLVNSRLGCFYCKSDVKVLYEQVRDSSQWTLDRVDNDAGHFRHNLLIACLGCNLRKKRMHPAKYVLTKQMAKVTKLNHDPQDG